MADLTFNTAAGQTIDRELMIAYLNTGTKESPVWSAIGKRVEESTAEYDWGTESKQDVLGSTYTTMKKPTTTQTYDGYPLDADDPAAVKLWNLGDQGSGCAGSGESGHAHCPLLRRFWGNQVLCGAVRIQRHCRDQHRRRRRRHTEHRHRDHLWRHQDSGHCR